MAISSNIDSNLNAAVSLFWKQGLLATSMRQLQQAMDMRPGSIYARFGSKEALYLTCMEQYGKSREQELQTCVNNYPESLVALRKFIELQLLEENADVSHQCLLQRTLEDLTDEYLPLKDKAAELLKHYERGFASILLNKPVEQDFTENELSLGRWFQLQFMGLRAYKGLGIDNDELKLLIDDVFVSVLQRVPQ